ncbi:hypothetical protein BS78_K016800 [Paspalum vaginatum]|uniref:Transposase (putative) gypsy type domain-containing protein n=1 Tax=Paspalum vaginatum TaxID=158149 RepID=A0A9W8CGM4_9POAL|nr:hypothetical protein BS78_K016800 [Paspalum vaginatum]
MGVLPPKDLSGWKSWKDQGAPTKDTHKAVVFAPFIIHGLGLPLCSFARGLLTFYSIDITHFNPNAILQIAIFIHLCDAFLGIVPHFGLWKYLYHCKPGMSQGVLQVVGGASLELRHGCKSTYLYIPLKDSNRCWHSEWFTLENHGGPLRLPSGRQPNTKLPSWEEAPTDEESAEAVELLAEIASLTEEGLTTQAVVIDFVFCNIQPLKDRVYPAYLYVGASDPTRETDRVFSEEEVLARGSSILKGKIHNEGTPQAYLAWHSSAASDITKLLSDPPQQGESRMLKRSSELTPQEMEAVVAATKGDGNNEATTFIVICRLSPDAENIATTKEYEGEAPKHEATAKKIAELENALTQSQTAYRNAITEHDEAWDAAIGLQKKLELEKKEHEKNMELKKVLSSTKEALKESRLQVKEQLEDLKLAKQKHEVNSDDAVIIGYAAEAEGVVEELTHELDL